MAEIHIPRVGLTAIVVQGESAMILQRAVGHIADTAMPGESGNVVLAGHRDTFFRPLKRVRIGDAITCFPFSYVGPAPDRFIVRARERERRR